MKHLRKIISLVSISLWASHAFAQVFQQDMQKLRESYSKNYLSMNVTYKMYNSSKDAKPYETMTMWMESFGKKLNYKGQGEQVIYTEKNMLMISESTKEIVLDTVTPNYNQPDNQILPIDTVSSHMKTITYKDLGNNQISYTLIPKDQSELNLIVYTISTKTWLIEKIDMHASSELGGGLVVISYSNIIKLAQAPANSFSFNNFIKSKTGGGYALQPNYSSYKFYHRNNYNNK